MVLELPQRGAHHIGMTILLEDLDTLIFQEHRPVLLQGELMKMMPMGRGLRGLLPLVTVRDVLGIMILLQAQNAHMVHWLVIIVASKPVATNFSFCIYFYRIVQILLSSMFLVVICSKDDVPTRYAEASVRQSRARLDYEMSAGASQYGDAYGDR